MDPNSECTTSPLLIAEAAEAGPSNQTDINQGVSVSDPVPVPAWWDGTGTEIARATRSWIQYGTLAFAVICIVIGAVEALFGR